MSLYDVAIEFLDREVLQLGLSTRMFKEKSERYFFCKGGVE